jgi:sec-independent protein translocase protein TatA
MGPVGIQEMIVIFLVALVLFGPKKLPELGKNLAKGLAEFKRAQSELKATFDREMQNLERETASARDAIHQTTNEIASYSHDSSNSTYTHDNQVAPYVTETAYPAAPNEIPAPSLLGHPTVSASEVSSAESHVEHTSLHSETGTPVGSSITISPTEGTVSRGSLKLSAENNPLPEFGQPSAPSTRPESSTELPSLA